MEPGGDTITNDHRVTINSTTSSGNTYTSSIQFTYLMEGDEGTYMCNVMILKTSGSASVVLETLTSKWYIYIWYLFTLNVVVPTPSVTVTAPNTQRVGQPLTLTCNAMTARGITSRVDMVWRRESRTLGSRTLRTLNNISPTIMDGSSLYSDLYIISALTADDDGREYECILTVQSAPIVTGSDAVILDLPGMWIMSVTIDGLPF